MVESGGWEIRNISQWISNPRLQNVKLVPYDCTPFGFPMKLVTLIKIYVNETCGSTYLSDAFHIQNGVKQGDALSPSLFNFALECVGLKVQENEEELKSSGAHQLVVYASDNLLDENNTIDTMI
jgi:hypothetical protein